ncbi:universal stress protein [Galbitalea soli]|uniref:Universal stress protein n=1 Tax=Galbitalea soli TaxID=1268042 RepID=A0A7C9TNK9_9MICO|nr:universal stress protein [Galbitalea soli]NEM90075.1 universal stress protein [Galbitalea soli]NYJ30782.1 nucleotide-binding universal stress UspA family protein [Galbitalea soli]
MPERIIVATDGGAASHTALRWAAERAVTRPVLITAVSVEETDWLPVGADATPYRRAYLGALDTARIIIETASPGTGVERVLLQGSPEDALAKASESADLLVIGSKHASALANAFHSTLSLQLASRTRCAMVVVPVEWRADGGVDGEIVVALDTDESSADAVDRAAEEAEILGCRLHIVHSWSIPTTVTIGEFISPESYDSLRAAHHEVLMDAVQRARAEHPTLHVSQTLQVGDPAALVGHIAAHARLLVVGTHHRGLVGSLVLGSVSHDLLVAMPCPIMVVPGDPTHRGTLDPVVAGAQAGR